MNILALGLFLTVLSFPSSGGEAVFTQEGPRLFFCPGFRAIDPADAEGTVLQKERRDPLWVIQKQDDWFPLRTATGHTSPLTGGTQEPKKKFFGCFLYNLGIISHFFLDLFFPYYGFPYYRISYEINPNGRYILAVPKD